MVAVEEEEKVVVVVEVVVLIWSAQNDHKIIPAYLTIDLYLLHNSRASLLVMIAEVPWSSATSARQYGKHIEQLAVRYAGI